VQFEQYRKAWRERADRQQLQEQGAAEQALVLAQALAGRLVAHYGATRVLLVGSLARGEFKLGSDIDLAVEGLSPAGFFTAGAELERMATSVRVDLVPLESANPFYRSEVARDGSVLA
jgi:uncharacterized protein